LIAWFDLLDIFTSLGKPTTVLLFIIALFDISRDFDAQPVFTNILTYLTPTMHDKSDLHFELTTLALLLRLVYTLSVRHSINRYYVNEER